MIDENRTMQPMSPAEYVIKTFGGVRATAKAIGRNPGSVSRWMKGRGEHGLSGNIPRSAQIVILKAAKKLKLDITAEDLILGRTRKRVLR